MPVKRYDRQFKFAAARLVLDGEAFVTQISRELEIPLSTLRRWAAEYAEHGEEAFPAEWDEIRADLDALYEVEVKRDGNTYFLRSKLQGTCGSMCRRGSTTSQTPT